MSQTNPSCATAVAAALSKQGFPYVWGAEGPTSFDCSGLMQWAYLQANVAIGRTTRDQVARGQSIPCNLSHLRGAATTCWAPGDLIFLRYSGGQHVAMYAGDGLFIDAYNENTDVILHDVSQNSFYQTKFWQARRMVTGCEDLTIDPGEPQPLPPDASIALETIAPIVGPVQLILPWGCGHCVEGVTELVEREEPTFNPLNPGYWFEWLGVQLWNVAALPIICWLLAIAQGVLNALAWFINTVLVPGLNGVWRILVASLLWSRDAFLALWSVLEWLRGTLWNMYGAILPVPDLLLTLGSLIVALFVSLFGLIPVLVELVLSVAQALLYLVSLFFALVPGLVLEASNPTAPPQVAAMRTNLFFDMFISVFEGIASSQLAWVWTAFIALCYLRFTLWLVDELGQLNS
ncbi:MAG: NlpC/P60 family protein [Chloroflexota bacterium]